LAEVRSIEYNATQWNLTGLEADRFSATKYLKSIQLLIDAHSIMNLLITLIAWEYPPEDEPVSTSVWDLSDPDNLMGLYITLANGIILEMKVEGDTVEAINLVMGMLRGAGSATPVTISETEKENLWLFEEGFESYQQGNDTSPGYIFLNPVSQPDKFE